MASRLQDFEPFHFTKSLGCAGYGILNGIFYAFLRRPHKFENFVNMIFHFISSKSEPVQLRFEADGDHGFREVLLHGGKSARVGTCD